MAEQLKACTTFEPICLSKDNLHVPYEHSGITTTATITATISTKTNNTNYHYYHK